MDTKTLFIAADGCTFNTEAECKAYEIRLKESESAAAAGQRLVAAALKTYTEYSLLTSYFGWQGSSEDVLVLRATPEVVEDLRIASDNSLIFPADGKLIAVQGLAEGSIGYLHAAYIEAILRRIAEELHELTTLRDLEPKPITNKYTCYVNFGGTMSYQIEAANREAADEKAYELFEQENTINILEGLFVTRVDIQEEK